jgi:hypothetical protein
MSACSQEALLYPGDGYKVLGDDDGFAAKPQGDTLMGAP